MKAQTITVTASRKACADYQTREVRLPPLKSVGFRVDGSPRRGPLNTTMNSLLEFLTDASGGIYAPLGLCVGFSFKRSTADVACKR